MGQWLDVKDTVNQWLEATVMDINETERKIFVHYNGWPTRWDEWLSFSSSRLAPFRTRTANTTVVQSSPAPQHSVVHAPATGADDVRILIPELSRLISNIQPVLSEAAALCSQVRFCALLDFVPLEANGDNPFYFLRVCETPLQLCLSETMPRACPGVVE